MSCSEFQDHLSAFIEGTLGVEPRHDLEAHLEHCDRCRELERILRGDLEIDAPPIPADLTTSILARTSGAPCESAVERLCARVDGELAELDTELVDGHLAGCTDCAAVATVLDRIKVDLPLLAHLNPPAGFAEAVLAATPPRQKIGRRMVEAWSAMLQRPRFAMESAYVGALVLWLVFGASFAPLRAKPAQALEVMRSRPAEEVQKEVSRFWQSASERGSSTVNAVSTDLERRVRAAGTSTRSAFRRGATAGGEVVAVAREFFESEIRTRIAASDENDNNSDDARQNLEADEGRQQ